MALALTLASIDSYNDKQSKGIKGWILTALTLASKILSTREEGGRILIIVALALKPARRIHKTINIVKRRRG